MINMDKQNEKISIKEVEEFQLRHDIKFPKKYVEFLINTNGGYPQASIFKISDEEGESVVSKFYGIGKMKGNLDRVFEILDGELPEGFMSIGDDPAGNEICIGINEKYYGRIYLWIHDMESDEELSNMFFLAESFNEFLNSLY